jgi:hypothetical protein
MYPLGLLAPAILSRSKVANTYMSCKRNSSRRINVGFLVFAALMPQATLRAQSAPYELSGQFTALSNSFNGLPGAHQPLLGWEASVGFPAWHDLRFKVDVSGFNGTNLSAQQHTFFILGGVSYEHAIRRERIFAQALFGDGGFNRYWGPAAHPGSTASFSEVLGGGLDTPITRHFAFRVEADMQHTNLVLIQQVSYAYPYHLAGLPNYFGRFSTGVVWTPRLAPSTAARDSTAADTSDRVPTELIFESLNSFGHFHIFADSWWSYLNVAGIEYERHSWGKAIGAQLDYSAEILPIVILRQPSKTDVWGDKLSSTFATVPGLGIAPIGLRMLWRDGKLWKPYYVIKGGMVGFTQKAMSNYASYENFTLQQAIGLQFRLTDRFDMRTSISYFHISNGFVVPNNPGIDEMSWNTGLSYHFQSRPRRF